MCMNGTGNSKIKWYATLVLGLWLSHVGAVLAADESPAKAQTPAAPGTSENGSIEEITITGERSMISLRVEIKRAQEDLFDLFNELNGSREFDVNCGDRIVTGSLIPAWQCEPVYMQRAIAQNTQDFLALGILPKTEAQLWQENRLKHEEFDEKIRTLAMQNPEFASSVIALTEKKRRLEELERQKRGKGLNGFVSRLMGKTPEE